MDARSIRSVMGVASGLILLLCAPSLAQFGRGRQFTANTQNFIVFASSPQWAAQVAEMAELNRRNLALHWLGKELPAWGERVPIHVEAGEHLGAGGETRFTLLNGNRIGDWVMSVSGTQERILDSVLPHEITHTIFATHFAPFGKYVPRWADEGACTTVEHISEKQKHQDHLKLFLQTRRGLAFNQMFNLKEYPPDIMPLYAQGHSAVQFLLDQGGPQKFVKFLEAGMHSENWNAALEQLYAYDSIGHFQTLWNQWLSDGSPEDLLAYAPGLQPTAGGDASLVSLASSAQPAPGQPNPPLNLAASSQTLALSQLPALGNESWYKRRLREVTGQEPLLSQSPRDAESFTAGVVTGHDSERRATIEPRQQAVGRSMAPQTAGIQVLDWGDSEPVPGIQSNLRVATPGTGLGAEMVPVYR